MTNAARNSAKTLATLQLVLGEIEEFLIQEGHTHLYDVVCTRPDRIEPATSIARHSRVYSSITVKHFNCCPLAHASNTKSYAQTCRADVAGWGRGRCTDTRRRGRSRGACKPASIAANYLGFATLAYAFGPLMRM